MSGPLKARWFTLRRAQNRKPATYRCPLCGEYLPSLSEHVLIAPEGDTSRRRHAHTNCVLNARKHGLLPTREEWLKGESRSEGLWPSVWGRLVRGRGSR